MREFSGQALASRWAGMQVPLRWSAAMLKAIPTGKWTRAAFEGSSLSIWVTIDFRAIWPPGWLVGVTTMASLGAYADWAAAGSRASAARAARSRVNRRMVPSIASAQD